jgi:hypothetical protein
MTQRRTTRTSKHKERHKELIDSLQAVMFPFQESEFEAESFTDIGRQRVDEWIERTLMFHAARLVAKQSERV